MKLFDDVQRDDLGPGKHGEPTFRVLNRSARASSAAVREFAEMLFASFPENGRPEFRARFRSDRDRDHFAAFFELYWCGWLERRGFEVQLHPPAAEGKTTHPDFLVLRDGQPAFYLECCVCCASDQKDGEDARLSEFFNALNKISSPDFFLHVRVDTAPTVSFSMKRLRREIEDWLNQIQHKPVTDLISALGTGPTFPINRGGGRIIITAMPKSEQGRGKAGLRTYGSSIGPWEMGDSSDAIRDSLKNKAKRYGVLSHPLVVAINCLDLFADGEGIATALFGFIRFGDEAPEAYRVEQLPKETLWYGPGGPVNTRVAAVLSTTNLYPWAAAGQQPTLWLNPWAKMSFTYGEAIGCKQVITTPPRAASQDGEQTVARLSSTRATIKSYTLFGLPNGWPNHAALLESPRML